MTHSTTPTQSLASYAVSYAERGWHVLPTRGKRPIMKDWGHEANCDILEARDAWHPRGPWATFNVAIACEPSGLVVLDIDKKDGRDGFAFIDKLHLPPTYSVRTPSGGLHLYFLAPEGAHIKSGANVLSDGIDVRAEGGIVIAAGSVLPNGTYTVENDTDPVPLPARLVPHLTAPRHAPDPVMPPAGVRIPQGQRDDALVRMAGGLRRKGVSVEAIYDMLVSFNKHHCDPPKSLRDIERIANSAGTWTPTEKLVPDALDENHPKVKAEIERRRVAKKAEAVIQNEEDERQRAVLGGMDEPVPLDEFMKSGIDPIEACLWGHRVQDGALAWAKGQGLLIVGPPTTGKSTIALQLFLRRAGILHDKLLGMEVVPSESRSIYFALDRFKQIQSSVLRMASPDADYSRFHVTNSIPVGVGLREPATWISWLRERDFGAILVDSAKDLHLDLNEPSDGSVFNFWMQAMLRAEIEVVVLHHTRKMPRGDNKPRTLDDVYGSTWIGAGAGSVLLLDNQPDEPTQIYHAKPLTAPISPKSIKLDTRTGQVTETEYKRRGGGGDEEDRESELGPLQTKILQELIRLGPASAGKIAGAIGGVDSSSVRRACRGLRVRGTIKQHESGAWELVPGAAE